MIIKAKRALHLLMVMFNPSAGSRTVTSQASGLPCANGMSLASSGRFSSVLDKPAGSLETVFEPV